MAVPSGGACFGGGGCECGGKAVFSQNTKGLFSGCAIFEDIGDRNVMIIAGKRLPFLLLNEGGRTFGGRSAFIKFCG